MSVTIDDVVSCVTLPTLHRNTENASDEGLAAFIGMLPDFHIKLLDKCNGMHSRDGLYRIFGIGCKGVYRDAFEWNSRDFWKFAWRKDLSEYLCFGETAWGDQYAYKIGEVNPPHDKVYVLDGVSMSIIHVFNSLNDFFTDFIRCSTSAYHGMDIQARDKYKYIHWDNHVAYVPSLLISNEDNITNTMIMPARDNLIINGDLERQLADESMSRHIKMIEQYIDERGLSRIQVIWG